VRTIKESEALSSSARRRWSGMPYAYFSWNIPLMNENAEPGLFGVKTGLGSDWIEDTLHYKPRGRV